MKTIITCIIILFSVNDSFSQMLLDPSEVLKSPGKYDGKFIGMLGTVSNLEIFENGNEERAMKFLLSGYNGDYITVRAAIEESWLFEGDRVNVSGIFYKDFGLGMEDNLLIISQGNYGESIIPYKEDKTIKLLDGLLKKLLK